MGEFTRMVVGRGNWLKKAEVCQREKVVLLEVRLQSSVNGVSDERTS